MCCLVAYGYGGMAIFSELKIVDFPGLCVASLRIFTSRVSERGNILGSVRLSVCLSVCLRFLSYHINEWKPSCIRAELRNYLNSCFIFIAYSVALIEGYICFQNVRVSPYSAKRQWRNSSFHFKTWATIHSQNYKKRPRKSSPCYKPYHRDHWTQLCLLLFNCAEIIGSLLA